MSQIAAQRAEDRGKRSRSSRGRDYSHSGSGSGSKLVSRLIPVIRERIAGHSPNPQTGSARSSAKGVIQGLNQSIRSRWIFELARRSRTNSTAKVEEVDVPASSTLPDLFRQHIFRQLRQRVERVLTRHDLRPNTSCLERHTIDLALAHISRTRELHLRVEGAEELTKLSTQLLQIDLPTSSTSLEILDVQSGVSFEYPHDIFKQAHGSLRSLTTTNVYSP
ncbi:hypothetical protein BD410DRAFT_844933 [Rickenella mellea]|uniref:Uncharacterized protein n=1 Tax=Rickenella mellea TaxID=50990 RepID=A0A4Y7PK76_9AGAM|nr:hypothetical protein BD410DRAFT_844933 [Rickenella mellea]